MTHESQEARAPDLLNDEALDQVAGGGDALQQIRDAVNDANQNPKNTMSDPYLNPPSQTCPSSLPYTPM